MQSVAVWTRSPPRPPSLLRALFGQAPSQGCPKCVSSRPLAPPHARGRMPPGGAMPRERRLRSPPPALASHTLRDRRCGGEGGRALEGRMG